ncbi:hypothetical protein DFJ73DRAFT_869183 [Zopfochytrium polystomum]|nr:hypothetical protein DFJ73DRAFT_869183 [Zopfochytrium polystomum]
MISISDAIPLISSYLPGPDRFILATLFRHSRTQALALYSFHSASLVSASGRGLFDLLDFRLRHATIPIGSVEPLYALLWTLYAREVPQADGSVLRLEWWDVLSAPRGDGTAPWPRPSMPWTRTLSGKDLGLSVARSALAAAGGAGHTNVLAWWSTCPLILCAGARTFDWTLLNGAIEQACANGHIEVLKWCRDFLPEEFAVPQAALNAAAKANQVNVIRWCEDNGTPIEAILRVDFADEALQLDHIARRLNAGLPMDHSMHTFEFACKFSQIQVLRWLRDQGCRMEWIRLKEYACTMGRVQVLQWWKEETQSAADPTTFYSTEAYRRGHLEVLRFLFDNDLQRDPSVPSLCAAAAMGRVAVFELLEEKGFRARVCGELPAIVTAASSNGRVTLLQWFKDKGFSMEMTESIANMLCSRGRHEVLDWWKNSGIEFIYDPRVVIYWSRASRNVLEWWYRSGLDVEWPEKLKLPRVLTDQIPDDAAYGPDKIDALQWWLEKMPDRLPPKVRPFRFVKADASEPPGRPAVEIQDLEWWRRFDFALPGNACTEQPHRWWVEANHVMRFGPFREK